MANPLSLTPSPLNVSCLLFLIGKLKPQKWAKLVLERDGKMAKNPIPVMIREYYSDPIPIGIRTTILIRKKSCQDSKTRSHPLE